MTEPRFTQFGNSRLYWTAAADPTNAANTAERVAAFYATAEAVLGDRPTLTQTWQDGGGTYVYLGEPVADSAGFLAALQTWVASRGPKGAPRFLWVADPALPWAQWLTTGLSVRAVPGGGWAASGANFQLRNYQLVLPGGGLIAPAQSVAGWGFVLADAGTRPAVTFNSPQGQFPARLGTTLLSMAPGHTGSWRFVIDAPAGRDAFERLGAGLRFFTPAPDGLVNPVRFAVVRQPDGVALEFHAQIDPLRPLDAERTSLGFFGDAAGAAAPPALPSGYATVLGHGVDLRPLAAGRGSTRAARLVFGLAPYVSEESGSAVYYLVPDGPFAVETAVAGSRVICGASGLEYLGLPKAGGTISFVPGQAAFAPLGPDRIGGRSLTDHGTTSWVRIEPVEAAHAVTYYSQPEDAPLYRAGEATLAGGIGLLDYQEVPAAAASRTPFPMVPFHGLAEQAVADAVTIEQLAIAPTRRTVLLPADSSVAADAPETVAVTPQGLAVGLAPDFNWNWLGIGHNRGEAAVPDLRFTKVDGPFRQAMQTNNLFLVLGDPAQFNQYGSVGYLLSTATLSIIRTIPEDRGGVPTNVLDRVTSQMQNITYTTRDAFIAALLSAWPPMTEEQQRVFLRFGGQLTPVAGGWSFRLSPDNWQPGTYLIVKFVLGRSIADLVGDISTWAWPAAASCTPDPADAQRAIQQVIDAARQAVREHPQQSSPYAPFLQVVDEPDWTGVLALSADVPLDQLPAELQVLAAGIAPERFRAHHVGLSLTPYQLMSGQLVFERSAMFGLIDYQNPEDQYFSEDTAFAFKVLQLTIGVQNSAVTTFTSRAELLVNRLFGSPTMLQPTAHGNNIILEGALQRQRVPGDTAEHDTYVFSMAEQNTFHLAGPVLSSVELLATQLVTAKGSDPASGDASVEAVFQLAGNLRFYEPAGFDPFCWGVDAAGTDGYLRFGGLGVGMTFALGDPAGTIRFTLKDGNLSFDPANSAPRPESLVRRFPIRLNGLIAMPDPALAPGQPPPPQTPADLGYVSVTAPIDQSVLTQPWYGLDYTVDLGSLGALAGSKALALQILVAWSQGAEGAGPMVYLGVRLPGAKGVLGVNLPLQGVVTMGFRAVEFLVDNPAENGPRSYTVRLRDFALRLLGLAFPPGHNDVVLFGNPDQSGASKVGWYLAYASAGDPTREPPPPVRAALRTERRG